jgi:hypothetical protein
VTGPRQDNISPTLRLSAQRALQGQVTPNIRKAYVRYRTGTIELLVIFDGDVSEDDRQRMEEVTSEILSDFPDIDLILASCDRIDAPERVRPEPMPGDLVFACVYARFEPAES